MAIFTVDTTSDTVNAGDGVLSLREALAMADGTAHADTVLFADAVQGRTIVLAGSQLTVASDVTIDGGSGVTLDADGKSRVFLVQGEGTDVGLQHLTVSGGGLTSDIILGGGGIRAENATALSLNNVAVIDNTTTFAGGGILTFGSLTLTDSTVSGNNLAGSFGRGGGISSSGVVTLTNSTVSGNSAAATYGQGGGIDASEVTLISSTVSGNVANGYGGGIRAFGRVTLTDSTVNGNTTDAHGGGVFAQYVTSINSSFSRNTAGDRGGGIYARVIELNNNTISDNVTTGDGAGGGGVFRGTLGILIVANSTVSGNSTTGDGADGGGIYADGGGLITIVNSIIAGNSAEHGTEGELVGIVTSSNGSNIFGSAVDGNTSGDLENVAATLLFAGGLADNGGPTQTIALRDAADNPALAGADPAAAPAADQRGEARPRPDGTNPDVGAFELDQMALLRNEIVGTERGEILEGTAGADLIRGLAGNDRLWGVGGDDHLFGGAGCDVLVGEAGFDEMTGGPGADRFLFRHLTDAPVGCAAYDEVLDVRRAQHDRIDLRPIDAKVGADGNQKFTFIGEHAFSHASQLRYEPTADGDFLVSGNVDRELDADFAFIVRTGLAQLRAEDFLL